MLSSVVLVRVACSIGEHYDTCAEYDRAYLRRFGQDMQLVDIDLPIAALNTLAGEVS